MCAVQLCAGQQTEKQQDIQSKETESKQTSRRHWVSQPLKWHHSQDTCKHSETGYALKGKKHLSMIIMFRVFLQQAFAVRHEARQ